MAIEAARLYVKVGAETQGAQSELNSFSDRLNAAARNLTMTGGIMTAGLTLPLVAAGKQAISLAGDFEQSMNVLQQVTGASTAIMASLNDQALQLGADTVFSAGEAAEGMLELAKAGMNTEQIMASIGGVMDLAAAGQLGLANAASITAATLNAFGLEASESVRVADILSATANASLSSVEDLGLGVQNAGFAFSMLNWPVEHLAASLAILSNEGLSASDGATAAKNALMRLMNPTVEARGVMDKLGISFYDAQGNMKTLPDIIDLLNVATADLTSEQRDAALATIFLSDGMKAIIPLMNAGKDGFNEMVGEVTEVGAASAIAEAMMKGLNGGIEELGGSVETFLVGAAQPFLGILGDMARGVGDAITWFGALPQPVINATLAFLGILAAAGPVLTGIGLIAAGLAFLTTPLGLVVTASAGLAAAWAADFMGMQGATASAFSSIQAQFDVFKASAASVGTAIGAAFDKTDFPTLSELWEDFKAGDFQTLASTIRDTAFDLMVNLNTELNITAQANDLKSKLIGVVNGLGTAISGLDFAGAQLKVDGLRDGILNGLTTAINGTDWAKGGATFAGMIDGLSGQINKLDFSAIDWSAVLTRVVLGPLGTAVNGLKWVIGSGEFEGLQTAVTGAIGTIPWGDLGTSLGGLGIAIGGQISKVAADIAKDTGIKIPELKWILPPNEPIALPPPIITVADPKPITVDAPTIKVAEPEFDFDWEGVGALPARIINGITSAFEGGDWFGLGQTLGGMMTVWWEGEMAKLGFIMNFGTPLQDFDKAWNDFQIQIGKEMRAGFDASDITTAIANLGTSISQAFQDMIGGLVGTIMGTVFERRITEGPDPILSQHVNLMAQDAPYWVTRLLGWEPKMPEWINSFLSWKPTTPQWVTDLLNWNPFGGDDTPSGSKGRQSPRPPGAETDIAELDWASFVPVLDWAVYVPNANWDSFVPRLNWSSYVPDVSWDNYLDEVSWGNYVPRLDWSRFIPMLFGGGTSVDNNAAGTSYFEGGMTWVGERGPELVRLPRGSRIFNNQESMAMAGGGGITVNIHVENIASDMDIEVLANRVVRKIQKKSR